MGAQCVLPLDSHLPSCRGDKVPLPSQPRGSATMSPAFHRGHASPLQQKHQLSAEPCCREPRQGIKKKKSHLFFPCPPVLSTPSSEVPSRSCLSPSPPLSPSPAVWRGSCCPTAPSWQGLCRFSSLFSPVSLSGHLFFRDVCVTIFSWVLNVYQFRTNS